MLYENEDFTFNATDESNWTGEAFEMVEIERSSVGWLNGNDPVFWCLAPAYLEDVIWLFRTAPTRQPCDVWGYPITLLEYYLRMDLLELLRRFCPAPKKVRDSLYMVWARVTERRNLSTINDWSQSFGPELDWLFERDPDLPPSWEVLIKGPRIDNRNYRVTFSDWEIQETVV